MLAAAAADLPLPVGRLALVPGHCFPVKTSCQAANNLFSIFLGSTCYAEATQAYAYLDDSSGSGLLVQHMSNFKNQYMRMKYDCCDIYCLDIIIG